MGARWKGLLLLLGGLLIGLVLGALVFFNGPNPLGTFEPAPLPPTVSSDAPDFSLPQLGASEVRLSDFRGTPVVINFWATWCAPCREEMPLLDETAARYGDRLVVVGINTGEDAQTVQGFIDEIGVEFPILLDTTEDVTDRYFVRNFPMTFFVDAEGVMQAQHLGLLRESMLERYLTTIGIEP